MRQICSSRIAAIALSLGLVVANATISSADPVFAAQHQAPPPSQSQTNSYDPSQKASSNYSPYDSPDFTLQDNNIHN